MGKRFLGQLEKEHSRYLEAREQERKRWRWQVYPLWAIIGLLNSLLIITLVYKLPDIFVLLIGAIIPVIGIAIYRASKEEI